MASSSDKSIRALKSLNALKNVDTLIDNIKNKPLPTEKGDSLPGELSVTGEGIKKRLEFLSGKTGYQFKYLTGNESFTQFQHLEGNIENYIGMAMVPTGLIGPVRVTGSAANGDFYVPLSTTEGALIASYHRGAKACYLAGGATSVCLVEGVQRSPLFKFANLGELGTFLIWLFGQLEMFSQITEKTSRFGKLMDMKPNIEGNHLILTFEYHTGDAAGQNMVTICTDAICKYIVEHAPVKPQFWFIESNYSGDKKATALSFSNVRGKKVTTEIILPQQIVIDILRTMPQAMADYWQSSTVGAIQSGSIGAQGHYANGLTALFLATGQDVACIAEAAVGITRMELTANGDLYASVTLPNLIVGTVGIAVNLSSCTYILLIFSNLIFRRGLPAWANLCIFTLIFFVF
ncbi:hydroxymethylglutaryl-CoA reductase [Mucilaginibacter paludis]|uniref:hydroxymethylglutaryl-CoA reductase (NADPH) n=1 Tax=Mucilaginibacter paludis DSM 18603 TaxID=714943 RepID=H1Y1E1_9SPHI|nr:hydroxymethylglutaryl-CoA reductase [Mucilaginibacter paludis]EHQ30275.1 hydroxymethylglutaryl-coenzyme A reductase [Mucilaginibacter paludis DSM 18603]